jgi:hypothetical protein
VKACLKLIPFFAVMTYLSLFFLKKLTFARDSIEYLLVNENNLPLVVFQTGYLSFITSVVMP